MALFSGHFLFDCCVTIDIAHVISDTRPSRFSACNIENWEGPGDEATTPMDISVQGGSFERY